MISVSAGYGTGRLDDADDGRGTIAQADRLCRSPPDPRPATSSRSDASAPPRPPAFGPSSVWLIRRPSTGRNPITSKYEPADDACADDARLTEADEREVDGREVAEGRQRPDCAFRSRISGTENLTLSLPMPSALWRM